MAYPNPNEEIKLSDSSDWKLFDQIEKDFRAAFAARSIEVCDGLDQAYHDLDVEGTVVTLHLEHYLGIRLFLRHPDRASEKDSKMLNRIKDYFETR